ncbi:MAG: hypothetical protein ACI9SE_002797 [Neolewinella sp.]|jgi:hypothetical protein
MIRTVPPTGIVLSGNAAEAVLGRIGHSKHADDQRAVVGFGRAHRPVTRSEVGSQVCRDG